MAWNTAGDSNLHVGDIVVIVGYFAFVLFVGLWVGASLFASNIGSLHFVGLAGSGAAAGIAIALYEFNAMFVVLGLGYIFLPVYIASGVFTMPEYLKRRFGGKRIQMYLAVLALLVYIFTKISADLYAGALFIEQAIGWDIYPAIMLLLAVAAIFTITGGLTAVLWTDLIQTIIMVIGAFVLMIISFQKVGGIDGLMEKYPLAIASPYANHTNITHGSDVTTTDVINTTSSSVHVDRPASVRSIVILTDDGSGLLQQQQQQQWLGRNACGLPREDFMHLFRDPVSGDLPWPGLLGIVINSVWYWCADQVIVQRSLAGKTYDHSKLGCILCGYLKLLPFFLLVLPGMIARVLFTDTVGCRDPEVCLEVCGSRTGCSNIAYPILVLNLLPAGARGMMLAVMMSALMSSLTSIFNSSATIFAMDVWTHVRHRASELEVMIVGRLFVVVLVVISIIWVPVLKASQGSQLFVYIQEVSSFLQPPICAIFILALLWPRFNEKGAFWALVVGMTIGLVRFAVQYSFTVPECGSGQPDPTPSFVKDVHYLYFSAILFAITICVACIVTIFTKPVDKRCIQRLTWWSRHSKEPCWDINKWLLNPEAYTSKMAADDHETHLTTGGHDRTSDHNNTTIVEKNAHSDDVKFIKKNSLDESEVKLMTKSANEEGEDSAVQTSARNERWRERDSEEVRGRGRRQKVESGSLNTVDDDECIGEAVSGKADFNTVVVEQPVGHVRRGGPSVLRRSVQWVCGVEARSDQYDAAQHAVTTQDMVSIKQHPRWKFVSNILAGMLIVGATAMMVIYA
ncbi:hypothetical protein ACOMHN_012574 [Nucella lapillus]